MNLVNMISCAAAAVIIAWGIYKNKNAKVITVTRTDEKGVINRKYEFLAVGIIVLTAIAGRIYLLGSVPDAVNQDSAMAAIDAQALITFGTDRLGNRWPVHMEGWSYAQMSALLDYLLIPVFKIAGISHLTLALPNLILSIFGMICIYLVVRNLFGPAIALITLALLAFNPWHFSQSRWALESNLFPHMFAMGFFFLQKGFKKSRYLYLAMVFFALSHYSYGVALYTVPLFLLAVIIWLIATKQAGRRSAAAGNGDSDSFHLEWKVIIWSAAIYLVLALPFFITMFINAFKLPTIETPFFTMQYFPNSIRAKDILFFADHKWEQFLINGKAVIKLILFQELNIIWDGVPQYGTVFIGMIPFFFLGIYAFITAAHKETGKKYKTGYMLLGFWSSVALLSGLITRDVNINRINLFHYTQIIFIAFGIHWVWRRSRKAFLLTAALVISLSTIYVREYFTDYADSFDSWETYSYNFTRALRDTAERECEVFYITPASQHPEAYDVSEIDTVYIHGLDIAYFMGKTNRSGARELRPYREQYQYIKAADLEIDPDLDAVYLINTEDRDLFSEDLFQINEYKQFCVVVPLRK